jgi:hypothetical protein
MQTYSHLPSRTGNTESMNSQPSRVCALCSLVGKAVASECPKRNPWWCLRGTEAKESEFLASEISRFLGYPRIAMA